MTEVILVPRNQVFPVAKILSSEILEAYKETIASYDKKARGTLDIFSDREGILAGSNCFAPIALRSLLTKDSRLATMADLGLATEINQNFLKGFYSDTGLVLKTPGDSYQPNDSLAKELAKQLKKRKINLNSPKVIYFNALDLKEDKDSLYGFSYDLREDAELGRNIIDAPELVENFGFRTMNGRGIPTRDNSGNRISYTRKDGLSRFFLGRDSYADSDGRSLAYSDGGGRVVVVSAEGVSRQNFQNLNKFIKSS